ncbi:MAG TPA: hypothetical protein VF752_10395 [Thermoleophilaceae bacterium]
MKRWSLIAVVASALIAASTTFAADRSGRDRETGVAFRLSGRYLAVQAERRSPRFGPVGTPTPPLAHKVWRAACGVSTDDPSAVASAVRRWPRGRHVLRFHLNRDVSKHARWCLIESRHDGADYAVANMRRSRAPRARAIGSKARAPD